MNLLHSTLDNLRDRWAPISHTSTFRSTGQITPEEFLLAGDYLVFKFPTWAWADASPASKRVPYLPPGKQYLVTRGVPCHRRLDANFAGEAGVEEAMVKDGLLHGEGGEKGGEDDGWLRTGGMGASQEARIDDVRTLGEGGEVQVREEEDEEEEIPDMEDEDDDEEAIIRDHHSTSAFVLPFLHISILVPAPKTPSLNAQKACSQTLILSSPTRTYTLYITYTPYYRTPRFYLSGYLSPSQPLPPHQMMDDIVGDYADKTVTLEDFPFFDHGAKMASVHPCRHASVMKTLLDRADAALKLRLAKRKALAKPSSVVSEKIGGEKEDLGVKRLVEGIGGAYISSDKGKGKEATGGGEEWEVLQHGEEQGKGGEEEVAAIRVDQYLVVFVKFLSTMTPSIEHDYTMGI
ncbi:MAG: hypothetical protein LQ351_002320 [Letrouitia transgressa]|nr:MAG: hypothetical protein LQ351_002320 [Letrouitia transgressa]